MPVQPAHQRPSLTSPKKKLRCICRPVERRHKRLWSFSSCPKFHKEVGGILNPASRRDCVTRFVSAPMTIFNRECREPGSDI